LVSIMTSLLPIEEHSSTSRSVSPMSCQQPVTDVPSVGTGCNMCIALATHVHVRS